MRTFVLFSIIMAIATVAFAQNADLPVSRSTIKISPQHFISNSLKVGIEHFNKNFSKSFVVFFNVTAEGSDNEILGGRGYNGLGGELQYRKYVSPVKQYTTKKNKSFYRGIYAAGFAQGGSYSGKFCGVDRTYDWATQTFTSTPYEYKEDIGNWAAGFTFGYQRTFWDVVFVDAFIGGGFQFSDRILVGEIPEFYDYADISHPNFQGILPKFGVQVGISL